MPYNLIIITLYLLVLVRIAEMLSSGLAAKVLLLFLFRTGLWMFLLYNGRPVVRLTHCLYLQEAVILTVLLADWTDRRTRSAVQERIRLAVMPSSQVAGKSTNHTRHCWPTVRSIRRISILSM